MNSLLVLLPLVAVVVAVVDKPCLGNSDKLACDKNGFYAKIQKQGDVSFCVLPHNGVAAYDTRTKGTPKCGPCFEKLHELFKNGRPAKGTALPRCDVGLGFYDVIQCDHSTKKCFCTDKKTGKTIKGSEKPLKNEQKITCDDIEIILWDDQFKDLTVVPTQIEKSTCDLSFDRGTAKDCKEKPSIRYFFHRSSYKTLAFEYLGCGGNGNNFKTPEEARLNCGLIDYFDCGAGDSAADFDGQSISCNEPMFVGPNPPKSRPGPKRNDSQCPDGYKCLSGHHIAICCSNHFAELAKDSYSPKCKNGKPLYTLKGSKDALLSTSCDANHCPKDFKCEQNFIFAYCCPK